MVDSDATNYIRPLYDENNHLNKFSGEDNNAKFFKNYYFINKAVVYNW